MSAALDFDGDYSLVVEGFDAGGVFGDGAEDVADNAIGALLFASGDDLLDAFGAEGAAMAVNGRRGCRR